MTVLAPAKLNLVLDVLGKRDDGYHEIESILHAIDLCDTLRIARSKTGGVHLEIRGLECPTGASNLVVRAANALYAAAGESPGASITLEKRIPMGAGLGGGSSDAAAALRGLNRLLRRPLEFARLAELAATLGSDVPFFLHVATSNTAICRGRGERVEAVPGAQCPHLRFVVVFPRVHVATASVYAAYGLERLGLKKESPNVGRCLEALRNHRGGGLAVFRNALTQPLRTLRPDLASLQDRLSSTVGTAFHVTGSGSAMFALIDDEREGAALRDRLSGMAVGDVFACGSLPALRNE